MATAAQIAAAKAEGYTDAEIAEHLGADPAAIAAGSAPATPTVYDPSAGGGTLSIGPIDTGVKTPEWLDRLMAGTGRGMEHTVKSLGNFVGLYPDAKMKEDAKIDAPLLAPGKPVTTMYEGSVPVTEEGPSAGRIGNAIGETAATAPIGMGVGTAAAKAAPVLAGALPQGVIQGATQGFSTADPGTRGLNTVLGGAAGAVGTGLTAGTKALINGLKRTDAAGRLIKQGIDLTPGQMNPNGAMNQFEQASESLPGAKQIIEPARDAAERQYQAKIIQAGAAPGAPPITPSHDIHAMLNEAYDSYKPLYDQSKGFPVAPSIMRTTGPDIPLNRAFQGASRAPGVPRSLQQSENEWLQDRLTQLPKNPDSADLLTLRSDIRARGRAANLKTDTDSGHIANIAGRAENQVTAALHSQLPQAPLDALQLADSNYGNYKIIENAVAKSKDNLAGLTPQKLSQSVYEATADPAYARGGGGALRQLAQDGAEVFQNVSPPTGARVATLGLGAAAGLGAPHVAIPLGVGALGTVGSQTGRSIAQGITKPQRLAQGLQAMYRKGIDPDVRGAIGDFASSGFSESLRDKMPALAQAGYGLITAPPWWKSNSKEEKDVRR